MRTLVLTLMLIVVAAVPSQAVLEWNDDLIVLRATATDTMVTARYIFRNQSSAPIVIRGVTPSCHCTTANLDKYVFASGETGMIVAQVELAGRRGLVENTIEVEHDDGILRIDRLRLNVEIGGIAKISPVFHFWNLGGLADTKVSIIEPIMAGQINAVRVEPSDRTFAWSLIQEMNGYELHISPRNLERKARTTFHITVQVGNDSAVQTVYAHVK